MQAFKLLANQQSRKTHHTCSLQSSIYRIEMISNDFWALGQ